MGDYIDNNVSLLRASPNKYEDGEVTDLSNVTYDNLFYPYLLDDGGGQFNSVVISTFRNPDKITDDFWWGFRETMNLKPNGNKINNAFCFAEQDLTFFIEREGEYINEEKSAFGKTTLQLSAIDVITGDEYNIGSYLDFSKKANDSQRKIKWSVPQGHNYSFYQDGIFGYFVIKLNVSTIFYKDGEFVRPTGETNEFNSYLNLLTYSPGIEANSVASEKIDIFKNKNNFGLDTNWSDLFSESYFSDISSAQNLSDDQKRALIADQIALLFIAQHPVVTADQYPSKIIGAGIEESIVPNKFFNSLVGLSSESVISKSKDRLFGVLSNYQKYNFVHDIEDLFSSFDLSVQNLKDPAKIVSLNQNAFADNQTTNGIIFNPYAYSHINGELIAQKDFSASTFNLTKSFIDIHNIQISGINGKPIEKRLRDIRVCFDVAWGQELIQSIEYQVFFNNKQLYFDYLDESPNPLSSINNRFCRNFALLEETVPVPEGEAPFTEDTIVLAFIDEAAEFQALGGISYLVDEFGVNSGTSPVYANAVWENDVALWNLKMGDHNPNNFFLFNIALSNGQQGEIMPDSGTFSPSPLEEIRVGRPGVNGYTFADLYQDMVNAIENRLGVNFLATTDKDFSIFIDESTSMYRSTIGVALDQFISNDILGNGLNYQEFSQKDERWVSWFVIGATGTLEDDLLQSSSSSSIDSSSSSSSMDSSSSSSLIKKFMSSSSSSESYSSESSLSEDSSGMIKFGGVCEEVDFVTVLITANSIDGQSKTFQRTIVVPDNFSYPILNNISVSQKSKDIISVSYEYRGKSEINQSYVQLYYSFDLTSWTELTFLYGDYGLINGSGKKEIVFDVNDIITSSQSIYLKLDLTDVDSNTHKGEHQGNCGWDIIFAQIEIGQTDIRKISLEEIEEGFNSSSSSESSSSSTSSSLSSISSQSSVSLQSESSSSSTSGGFSSSSSSTEYMTSSSSSSSSEGFSSSSSSSSSSSEGFSSSSSSSSNFIPFEVDHKANITLEGTFSTTPRPDIEETFTENSNMTAGGITLEGTFSTTIRDNTNISAAGSQIERGSINLTGTFETTVRDNREVNGPAPSNQHVGGISLSGNFATTDRPDIPI